MKSRFILFLFISQIWSQINTDWWKYESDSFIIYYPKELEWDATELISELDQNHQKVIQLLGNNPGKTTFIIEDGGFKSHAWFSPVESTIHQYVSPPSSDFFGGSTTNHLRSTAIHEFAHATHISSSTGLSKLGSNIFGSFIHPNSYAPDWIIEGISVTTNSEILPNEGMLRNGWVHAQIATQAKTNTLPDVIDLTYSPNSYFSHNDEYIIGSSFIQYLNHQFGVDKMKIFIDEMSSYWWSFALGTTFPIFAVDKALKKVYNQNLTTLYSQWKTEMVRKHSDWNWDGKQLTGDGWYKKYITAWKGKLYYMKMFYSNKDVPFYRLIEFDPILKKEFTLLELNRWITSPIRIKMNRLFFTVSDIKKGYPNVTSNSLGTRMILYSLDLNTGKQHEIVSDSFRSFCILNSKNIILSINKRNGFGSQLWKMDGDTLTFLRDLPLQISEMVANENHIFLSAKESNSHFNLYKLNLDNLDYSNITNNNWNETELNLVDDLLVFTAHYKKEIGIYGYDLSQNIFFKLTDGGFSRRGVASDSLLYFISLTENGEDIFVKDIVKNQIDIPQNNLSIPNRPLKKFEKEKVDYSVYIKLITPYLRTPYYNQTTSEPAILLKGSDVLSHFKYSSLLNYSTENSSISMTTGMHIQKWAPVYIHGYTDYSDALSMSGFYPISISSKIGKPNISLTGNIHLRGKKFREITFTPGLSLNYGYALKSNLITLGFPIYRTPTPIKNSYGILIRISSVKKNNIGFFRLNTMIQWQSSDKISFLTKGNNNIFSSYGLILSPSFTFQLFKIRKGIWNINSYLEDLNGKVFIEHILGEYGKNLTAIGGELSLETKLSMGFLKFSPMMGIVLNQQGKWNSYFQLNFPIIR